jgi:PAS domain S-box-containing protein
MLNNHFREIAEPAEQPQASPSSRNTAVAAAIAITLGLLVLIGWANDFELLKRMRPGFAAMNPLAACCFILAGIALLLAKSGHRRAAFSAGGFICLITLAKAADMVSGAVPIDQLLFAETLASGSALPNRMAPNTTLAFFLVALGLMFSCGRKRAFGLISQGLGAAGLLISIFALIGYAFGINHLNSVGPLIPMAFHTGLGLAITSIGVMSLTPQTGLVLVLRDPGSAGSMGRIVLPLAILIPVTVGAMRLLGQNRGYYGTEAGVALQVIANVVVTSVLLSAAIIALHRSDCVRRKREHDLGRSEERYRLAEKVAQVGHWRMDLPSLEVNWSDEVFRITGVPQENGVPSAMDILDIYHPDDRALVRQHVRNALREGTGWEDVVRLRRPGGEVRHVSSHGVCERDEQGRLTGLFGVFADITELEHARRKAEEATAAKAAFLANMSHEIRTPLNGVMGFAELLLGSELGAEQKRHATLVFESAQTLLKLLNDILDVSKIDAGQLEIAQEPFDLAHQLRQCVRLMEAMAQKKGLELILNGDSTLPKHIVGDGLRIRQILLNLLGNAIKFTACGSVTVQAAATMSDAGLPVVEIDVIDTGVGIAKARQALIFDEFVQADASTSRRFGGSGLGLTISRRLAELMGGDIRLTSDEGFGTRVTLVVPLKTAEHPLRRVSDRHAEPAVLLPGASSEDRGITILLAEDLDINQELITGMLARMGYKTEIAADGEEAIRLAGRLVDQPDAYGMILMDIQMPVVDGIAATKAIRGLGGRASQIPIVALTANAYEADIHECRNAGMVDHLSKPVSMAMLGATLTRWLRKDEPRIERRAVSLPNMRPLADKFADRKSAYAARLAELGGALSAGSPEERESLIAEAEEIAHKIAGTAAMFGEPELGEAAAEAEDGLKEAGDGSVWIGHLLKALRRAA